MVNKHYTVKEVLEDPEKECPKELLELLSEKGKEDFPNINILKEEYDDILYQLDDTNAYDEFLEEENKSIIIEENASSNVLEKHNDQYLGNYNKYYDPREEYLHPSDEYDYEYGSTQPSEDYNLNEDNHNKYYNDVQREYLNQFEEYDFEQHSENEPIAENLDKYELTIQDVMDNPSQDFKPSMMQETFPDLKPEPDEYMEIINKYPEIFDIVDNSVYFEISGAINDYEFWREFDDSIDSEGFEEGGFDFVYEKIIEKRHERIDEAIDEGLIDSRDEAVDEDYDADLSKDAYY